MSLVVESKDVTDAKPFQVFVKRLLGTTMSVNVSKTDLVYNLMESIATTDTSASLGAFKLIFAGRLMEPHQLISFYNVQQESTVHLLSSMRGSSLASFFRCIQSWQLMLSSSKIYFLSRFSV